VAKCRSISCWPRCGIKRCRLNAELTRRRRPHPMFIHGWQRQRVQKRQLLFVFKSLPTRLCCSDTQMSSYGQKVFLRASSSASTLPSSSWIRDAPDSAFSLSSAGSDHADPERSSRQCNRRQKLAGSISKDRSALTLRSPPVRFWTPAAYIFSTMDLKRPLASAA
jgi:hypothetical protein